MDILLERKSVRKYKNESVKEEDLNYMLRAAMSAPTARNTRCWSFIVVKDKETHKKIAAVHKNAQMILDAPLAVVIAGDTNLAYNDYLPQDCAAAAENLLLGAVAKGYGAVWCGVYGNRERQEHLEKLFNLPENIKAFALIVIGKPDDSSPAKNGWDPSKIKYEKW
ncbi:MAG: nitroreductase family protein [Endomicrobia bacterium]|nr:nitroreductase family protein [Endomicrobiia bacterium]